MNIAEKRRKRRFSGIGSLHKVFATKKIIFVLSLYIVKIMVYNYRCKSDVAVRFGARFYIMEAKWLTKEKTI